MSTAARWHRWTPEPARTGTTDPEATLPEARRRAVELLSGRRLAVLTGAGLSTDSGIPDYRGPDAKPRTPMTYQEFIGDARRRRHYWARNHVGYRFMSATVPNAGHHAVARLESRGLTSGIITQNIDRLHEAAGALNVVDLHGRFDHVVCLDCASMVQRAQLDRILTELNPGFAERVLVEDVEVAPDADAVIESTADFVVAPCPVCGGVLKPDVTFFGENVPRDRVARSYGMVDCADGLLVAGSSLAVMSGLRFVRRAHQRGIPVVIVNRGQTRGDDRADLLIQAGVSETLGHLAEELPDR
ncbi:NAD-dependent protein deacetylase [Tersicoccus solisilvae]|uniref:protein acetyllysine N-acetyltransferase n=1 Tax=Tersicoccus solisilvae TaxID=1882339 RepID=A0ABQ1PDR8_9MICC|nr:Sir2 family NAD-dependent protein deacetylase [Tersicoccus solisilvae]GGC95235.1 NAD-dependent protein deacetylase [Tersicoccus solisilvae]